MWGAIPMRGFQRLIRSRIHIHRGFLGFPTVNIHKTWRCHLLWVRGDAQVSPVRPAGTEMESFSTTDSSGTSAAPHALPLSVVFPQAGDRKWTLTLTRESDSDVSPTPRTPGGSESKMASI